MTDAASILAVIVTQMPSWSNWLGNYKATPERLFYPRSCDDLVAIVRDARSAGRKVRVAGAGHSTSPLVPTDDYLVDTRDLNRVTAVDAGRGLATVESGTTIAQLDAELRRRGLAIPSSVVLTSVRYGGVIATGSHGSGWDCGTLSDLVEAMTIVTATGEVVRFSEATHGAEMMSAVRVNLGMFGLIYDITLRVEPDFSLEVTDERVPLSLMREPARLRELVRENYFVDVFWFPLSSELWIKRARKTSRPAVSATWLERLRDRFDAAVGSRALPLITRFPRLTRVVNELALKWLLPRRARTAVRDAVDAIHYKRELESYHCQLSSMSVKIDERFQNPSGAWCAAMDATLAAARLNRFPLNLMLQARFIGASRALLSPAFGAAGDHHCYLEILSARGTAGCEPFFDEISALWMRPDFGSRPHWGKYFHSIPGILPHIDRELGDNLRRFATLREQIDPGRMFLTPQLEKIFLR